VARLRISARRGQLDRLALEAKPLVRLAHQLDAFIQAVIAG
jgi:hypothetical protein